jgi:hypothetical protein
LLDLQGARGLGDAAAISGFGIPWFFSPYSMFLRTDMCG